MGEIEEAPKLGEDGLQKSASTSMDKVRGNQRVRRRGRSGGC